MNFLLDVFRDLWYEKIEEVTTAVLIVPRSRVGGVYAPALTQHHPACFKRLKWKFSQHQWGRNDAKYYDEDIAEKWWKYLGFK